MSNTSAHSKNASPIRSTQAKRPDLNAEELELVAERLSLIRGHIGKMPLGVVSGAMVREGYLLVALKIEGHEMSIKYDNPKDLLGSWLIDGKDITPLTEKVV
jgi:hypothetical protein